MKDKNKHKNKREHNRKDKSKYELRMQMLLKLMHEKAYVPMKEKELAVFLQVAKKDRDELHKILEELIKAGKIEMSKRGRYFMVDEPEPENRIVVGTYERSKNHYGFVIPDDSKLSHDIFIPVERSMGAVDGHKVVVEITDFGSKLKSPEGRITEILGYENDPGVDVLSIIKGYDLPTQFPEKVLKQADKVKDEATEEDIQGRLDLRDLKMVTIDSEEAKDLDDAVSVYKDGEYYVLGVHIADVTHYVQEHSALDKEALKRGTSVYLVDRVLPMLPPRLSNGICSLNENVDRLTLSCIMTFDKMGKLINHDIAESVIRTNRRMTYATVNGIIEDNDKELMEEYRELVPMFFLMKELAGILRNKRLKRGAVDFDLPETKITLDDKGRPVDIRPYDRNEATRIIEDFMLAANETVAEHYRRRELPFIYRVHEKPDPEKIHKLEIFIRKFGYSIKVKNDEVHPKELKKLLERIKDTPQEALISSITLRSMQRAKYSTDCLGHYGLSCKYYCHFTSPIRRYPDLQIHRIIKESLHGKLKDERILHYHKILDEVAARSSSRERLADEAERETDKLKKAEYMQECIGEEFEGVISGVTNWGIYVGLPNTIEGLVHISKIEGDYYDYDEDNYELTGKSTGSRYTLGQRVRVRVSDVDLSLRAVDFVLA